MRRTGHAATCAVAMMLLVACTSSPSEVQGGLESPKPRATSPTKLGPEPPIARSLFQDLLPGRGAPKLVAVDSNLPSTISLPVSGSTPFLDDPPVRAVVAAVGFDRTFEAESFADHSVHFLGVDGDWRVLKMAELGIAPEDWGGPDGSGLVDLSPNGRWGSFSTATRVGVIDMATGQLNLRRVPDGGRPSSPALTWTEYNTLLVSASDTNVGFDLDPVSGQLDRLPAPSWKLGSTPSGALVTYEGKGRQLYAVQHSTNGRTDPVKVPFRWNKRPGQYSRTQVALFNDNYSGASGNSRRSFLLAAKSATFQPVAALDWRAKSSHQANVFFGWVDQDNYLIRYGQEILVWSPRDESVKVVSQLRGDILASIATRLLDLGSR